MLVDYLSCLLAIFLLNPVFNYIKLLQNVLVHKGLAHHTRNRTIKQNVTPYNRACPVRLQLKHPLGCSCFIFMCEFSFGTILVDFIDYLLNSFCFLLGILFASWGKKHSCFDMST